MKYKMIISDYDGTLSDCSVAPIQTKRAIDKFRAAGGKFAIVTGRATGSIENVIDKSGLNIDAYGSNQGAFIFANGKAIHKGGINKELAASIVKCIRDFNRDVAVFTDELNYEGSSESLDNYVYWYSKTVKTNFCEDLAEFCLNDKEKIGRIVFLKQADEDVSFIVNELNKKFNGSIVVNSGAPTIVEIVSANENKYTASRFLAEYFGLKEDEVITMGDSSNDLMLLSYGFPIAVGNADLELKNKAKYISLNVTDFPITDIVEKALKDELF